MALRRALRASAVCSSLHVERADVLQAPKASRADEGRAAPRRGLSAPFARSAESFPSSEFEVRSQLEAGFKHEVSD